MAELTIKLRTDPETGRKDILVSLKSEEDALPLEHENLHKELVEKLIEDGLMSEGEAGKLVIAREEEKAAPREKSPQQEQQPETESQSA